MSLHNVKPSTTFLIRNYFVADCVAHRSREPAKTDSMDLSPRPGTRQPLPAEIHGRNALLIALAINEVVPAARLPTAQGRSTGTRLHEGALRGRSHGWKDQRLARAPSSHFQHTQ